MVTTAADDPIRAEVERRLHAIVDTTIAAPLAVVSGTRRCVARRIGQVRERVVQPARIARSLLDLVGRPTPADVVFDSVTAPPVDRPASLSRPTADPSPQVPRPTGGDAADLPIDEYESLAASQVVARLPTLTRDELVELRRFESDHRGRRTVLGKIDQLLAPT